MKLNGCPLLFVRVNAFASSIVEECAEEANRLAT
jgi:hypothetical protein